MNGNSAKPLETGNRHADAVRMALGWLDREGRGQRNARALRELLDVTLTAISRGEPPPEMDTTTLRLVLQQVDGDPASAANPLRAAELQTWWKARETQLRQECVRRECAWIPRLVVKTGGGRNLPSRISIDFEDVDLPEVDHVAPTGEGQGPIIQYRIDPAKPALWLRLIVGNKPFAVQSWRGYLVIGMAAVVMLLIGVLWLGLYAAWARGQAISTATLAQFLATGAASAGLWSLIKPIRDLPTERVTMAGSVYLALSELHGQLRTMRRPEAAFKSREFSVVRHWGVCPICSAEVDLDAGGAAFPGRLVGRCHDAPLEHVFSFDPVRLSGSFIR